MMGTTATVDRLDTMCFFTSVEPSESETIKYKYGIVIKEDKNHCVSKVQAYYYYVANLHVHTTGIAGYKHM